MKRSLLCLLLAALMVFTCFAFAGCSEDKEEEKDPSKVDDSAMTLTLWLPTDENTTEEAILAVQEAINKITKANYDTAIELHAINSAEYEAAVDARIEEIKATIQAEKDAAKAEKDSAKQTTADSDGSDAADTTVAVTEAPETTGAEDETYVNDKGMTVVKYPEVGAKQMDIFLVRGYTKYAKYIKDGALSALDSQINSANKVLKQYIYPTFLTAAKVSGATYAIPNNHPIGEYKYLLVNKRLVEELHWSPEDLTTLVDCQEFIFDVDEHTDVTPFAGTVEPSGIYFWCEQGGWNVAASQVRQDGDTTYHMPRNIFKIPDVGRTIYLGKLLEERGCIVEDPTSVDEFGVAVITGDASDRAKYEDDYYVHIHDQPRAESEDLYKAMFVVSTYTKSVDRSMEIITAINTDPEIRTILQYGVEDVHWRKTIDDDSVIEILSEDYKMTLVETGNVYMTYPEAGVSKEYWDVMKQQNQDLVDTSILPLDRASYVTDDAWYDLRVVELFSGKFKARIDAMSAEEFKNSIEALRAEIDASKEFQDLMSTKSSSSLINFYNKYTTPKK